MLSQWFPACDFLGCGFNSAKRARGPAGPDRICCKAEFVKSIGFIKVFKRFSGNHVRKSIPSEVVLRAPSDNIAARQGNLSFPLYFQWFPACAFAAGSVPRSALGAPAGPDRICCKAGNARNVCFYKVFDGFRYIILGLGLLPRGAPRRSIGIYWFYNVSQHSGWAPQGASQGLPVCCKMLI